MRLMRPLMRGWRAAVLGIVLAALTPCWAAEPVNHLGVVLLQPSAVLEARVASVDAMADYIRQILAAASANVRDSGARQDVGGYVVVAVKPGGQARLWLDFDTLLDTRLRQALLQAAQTPTVFEVREGPVVFALRVSLFNGKGPKRLVPLPHEWRGVSSDGTPLEVGALVARIWPDEPAPTRP